MPLKPLPGLRLDADGAPFLPSFRRELKRLIDQLRTGFPVSETAWGAYVRPGPYLFL